LEIRGFEYIFDNQIPLYFRRFLGRILTE
jgi:hypothetical protein